MTAVGRIYLDTNVFIAAFEARGDAAEQLLRLFSNVIDVGLPHFVTSEMTLAELLVMPFRSKDTTMVTLYSAMFSSSPWLDVQPATRTVFLKAAQLRAQASSRKLPDAVHLATAILSGCTYLLSSDRGIGPRPGEDLSIRLLTPDEPTLTSLLESLSP